MRSFLAEPVLNGYSNLQVLLEVLNNQKLVLIKKIINTKRSFLNSKNTRKQTSSEITPELVETIYHKRKIGYSNFCHSKFGHSKFDH
jgi:hypothetical protein